MQFFPPFFAFVLVDRFLCYTHFGLWALVSWLFGFNITTWKTKCVSGQQPINQLKTRLDSVWIGVRRQIMRVGLAAPCTPTTRNKTGNKKKKIGMSNRDWFIWYTIWCYVRYGVLRWWSNSDLVAEAECTLCALFAHRVHFCAIFNCTGAVNTQFAHLFHRHTQKTAIFFVPFFSPI